MQVTLNELFKEAAASFLRTFGAALLVLIPGILAAPNISTAAAMSWGASAASIVAGLKAIQVLVPDLSIGYLLTKLIGAGNAQFEKLEDSFARAFVGTFLTLISGAFAAPDFSTGKSLAIAAIIGAFSAGIRAIQGDLTPTTPGLYHRPSERKHSVKLPVVKPKYNTQLIPATHR